MDINELEPLKTKQVQKNLDEMSIAAIGEYIEELRAEIERADGIITEKLAAKEGASQYFKT